MTMVTARGVVLTLLMLSCAAMLTPPGMAQIPPLFPFPGLLPPGAGTDKELMQCWSSLLNIQGCVWEIGLSFLNGHILQLGPACCKAITEIKENCWPKMFPSNPFFPPLLKQFCAGGGVAPGPTRATVAAAAPSPYY